MRQIVAAILIVAIVLGYGGAPALAEYARLLSPHSGSTVSGTIEISAGFESGKNAPVTRVTISVDGQEYGLKVLDSPQTAGVVSMLLDSTAFADGPHGISLYFYSGSKLAGKCYQKVQFANRREEAAAPPSKGPALIQFKNLRDGERVSGKRQVAVNPDSSLGQGVFLSVHVDRALKLISNRPPFEFALDTTELADGTHLVEAQVRDAAQNLLATHTLRITVENAGTLAEVVREASRAPSATRTVERPSEPRGIPATAAPAASDTAIAARAPEAAPDRAAAAPEAPGQAASVVEPPAVTEPAMATPQVRIAKLPAAEAPAALAVPEPSPVPETAVQPSAPEAVAVSTPTAPPDPASQKTAVAETTAESSAARASEQSSEDDSLTVTETASSLPQETTEATEPQFKSADADARADESDVTARPRVPAEAPAPVSPAVSTAASRPAMKPETRWQGHLARAIEDPRISRPPLITTPGDKPRVADKVERVRELPPRSLVEPNAGPDRRPIAGEVLMAALPAGSPKPAPDGLTARPAQAADAPVAPPSSSAASVETEVKSAAVWPEAAPKAESGDATARPQSPAQAAPATAASATAARMALAPSASARPAAAASAPTAETVTYQEPRGSAVRGPAMFTLRMAMERLGGTVSWHHLNKTATVLLDGNELIVDTRAGTATVNGRQVEEAHVVLTGGRIHLSALEIAKEMGIRLTADPRTHQVRLSRLVEDSRTQ